MPLIEEALQYDLKQIHRTLSHAVVLVSLKILPFCLEL